MGERFDRALGHASKLHRTQARKGTEIPYISHLLAVASLVIEAGGDEDQAIAALLHDAPEDQRERMVEEGVDIERDFGSRVQRIVEACTDVDPGSDDRGPESSLRRKDLCLEHLRTAATQEALLVSCADKLHNAHSIVRDLSLEGDAIWERFNVGREEQLRYCRGLVDAFRFRAVEPKWLVDELEWLVGVMGTGTG